MMTMIDNIQHRGAGFTELHRDFPLRPLRIPLRPCVKNSNAEAQRVYSVIEKDVSLQSKST